MDKQEIFFTPSSTQNIYRHYAFLIYVTDYYSSDSYTRGKKKTKPMHTKLCRYYKIFYQHINMISKLFFSQIK